MYDIFYVWYIIHIACKWLNNMYHTFKMYNLFLYMSRCAVYSDEYTGGGRRGRVSISVTVLKQNKREKRVCFLHPSYVPSMSTPPACNHIIHPSNTFVGPGTRNIHTALSLVPVGRGTYTQHPASYPSDEEHTHSTQHAGSTWWITSTKIIHTLWSS